MAQVEMDPKDSVSHASRHTQKPSLIYLITCIHNTICHLILKIDLLKPLIVALKPMKRVMVERKRKVEVKVLVLGEMKAEEVKKKVKVEGKVEKLVEVWVEGEAEAVAGVEMEGEVAEVEAEAEAEVEVTWKAEAEVEAEVGTLGR